MRRYLKPVIAAAMIGAFTTGFSVAQEMDLTKKETYDQIMAWAKEPLDTSKYKKDGDLKIGLSAGYLSNAWINFTAQSVKYEASLRPEIKEVKVTDAAFNPTKQAADIEDLLTSGVDAILFWPVDEKGDPAGAAEGARKGRGHHQYWLQLHARPGRHLQRLCQPVDLQRAGGDRIRQVAERQGKGFRDAADRRLVGRRRPARRAAGGAEGLSRHGYGDWDRAKAKQLTENLLQRFPEIDGAFSPAGQMSMGIYEAFDEAGRLGELTLSPGDDYNGWTKLVAKEGKWGSVTSGLDVGREAVKQAVNILTGKPTTTAVVVPTRYLDPGEAAKLNEPDRPDDWFKTDLPKEFAAVIGSDSSTMPLVETHALTRRFPGVLALDHVVFFAESGEVHAVCGANGAGKSTLMNILSGTIRPTSGTISIAGQPVAFASPADARDAGVAIVYQELSSIPELTVADNIFLGREFKGRFGTVDRRAASRAAAALLDRFGIGLSPDASVGALGVADRQLVELARALATDARILILDEPTAVLSISEQAKLFAIIRTLRQKGLLILYISHRVEEIFEIAEKVSVMRDGAMVATRDKAGLTSGDLIRLMTGREVSANTAPAPLSGQAKPVLTLRGISQDATPIDIRRGEIFGLAGLVGAGRTSIAHRIAGLRRRNGFSADLDGAPLPDDPAKVLAAGIVYVTEDRKRDGIFGPLAVTGNATAASLDRFSLGGFLRLGRERAEAGEILRGLRLVAASLDTPIGSLSGGNQQKVLFARALLARPKVLICDEPTRGVDVGARQEIYAVLRRLSAEGVAIILISSELTEVLALSHRIAIVRHGRVSKVMDNAGLDEHALLVAATGSDGKVAAE